jgi:hypothetical protein
MAEQREMYLRLDDAIKAALVADVRARGSNMNAVAVGILADNFAVPYSPTSRHATPGTESNNVLLTMPYKLKRKIGQAALNAEKSESEIAQRVLAEHYGLRYFPPPRGRRRSRAAA